MPSPLPSASPTSYCEYLETVCGFCNCAENPTFWPTQAPVNVVTFGANPTYQPTYSNGGVTVAGDSEVKKAGVRTGSA